MTRAKRSRKVSRITEDVRLGRAILPAGQARPGAFVAVDIANHSDGDQRAMVRARVNAADRDDPTARRTIRRKPKLDTAPMRKLLNAQQIAACEWYAQMHGCRYDTTGVTANWGATGGRGRTNFDHLPKTREQEDALANYDYARAGISPSLIGLFERVVLHGGDVGRRRLAFAVAVEQLVARIEGRANL